MLNNRRVRAACHPAVYIRSFDHDADADRDASSPPLATRYQTRAATFFGAPDRAEWFVFDVQPFLRANVGMSKQVLARTGRTSLSQAKKNRRRFPAGGFVRSWSDELDYQLR